LSDRICSNRQHQRSGPMQRIKIHLRPIGEYQVYRATVWKEVVSSMRHLCDVRFLAAVALVLIALARLAGPEPAQKLAPSQIAQGEQGTQLTSFAYSPTGEYIVTSNSKGWVTLRARANGWQIERSLDFPGFARSAAFSPDGRFLAVVGISRHLCIWDLKSSSSQPTRMIVLSIDSATRVGFSPDGQSLAVMTERDGTMLLRDLATRRERVLLHHRAPVTGIAFSPSGRYLATSEGGDRSIFICDLQTRAPRMSLEDGREVARAFAFSPDGALLASAGRSGKHVQLWDLNTRRVSRVFIGHKRSVNSIAFSPDGSLLATASNDGTLGLWSVATGERRARLDGQATLLNTVAFSPDGRTLVLGTGDDDNLRMWDLVKLLGGHQRQALR
jgi:WD40 repeat protein